MNAETSITRAPPLVAMRGISKSFGVNAVLRDVDFDVAAGEVHALLGENGAGKSTLMKVLMGVHKPDAGTIALAGESVTGASVEHNLAHGIAMIFQELSLMPNLTVGDNIMMGREPRRPGWVIDKRRIRRDAQAVIDRYKFPLRAGQLVRDLGNRIGGDLIAVPISQLAAQSTKKGLAIVIPVDRPWHLCAVVLAGHLAT